MDSILVSGRPSSKPSEMLLELLWSIVMQNIKHEAFSAGSIGQEVPAVGYNPVRRHCGRQTLMDKYIRIRAEDHSDPHNTKSCFRQVR